MRTVPIGDMVTFALRWGAFDGDEYIFPEFGIAPAVFYRRLLAFLEDRRTPVLNPLVHDNLLDLCRRKARGAGA